VLFSFLFSLSFCFYPQANDDAFPTSCRIHQLPRRPGGGGPATRNPVTTDAIPITTRLQTRNDSNPPTPTYSSTSTRDAKDKHINIPPSISHQPTTEKSNPHLEESSGCRRLITRRITPEPRSSNVSRLTASDTAGYLRRQAIGCIRSKMTCPKIRKARANELSEPAKTEQGGKRRAWDKSQAPPRP